MTKFEEEFNYLIELSGKVLIGQVDAEAFEKNRIAFFEKYEIGQPQSLPVVPECVAEFIDESKGNLSLYGALFFICDNTNKELNNWVFREANQNLFARAWLEGYTVEKPQLFYLKNKIELEEVGSDLIGYLNLFLTNGGYLTNNINRAKKFTKQEIDSMAAESYEQIEVVE